MEKEKRCKTLHHAEQQRGLLSELFPYLPIGREAEALLIYSAVFDDLPLSAWTRQGTVLTRFVNRKKLNFAPRRSHCTIGFRGHAAIEFYRFIGGECPAGEVTIKIPYSSNWEPRLIVETISWYFYN